MAGRPDDGAALQARGEAASDANCAPQQPADQSLHAPATATASAGSGSARERASVLNLNATAEAGDLSAVVGVLADEPTLKPLQSGRDIDPLARSELADLELSDLRLELTRVHCSLQAGEVEVDRATSTEEPTATAVDAPAVTDDSEADSRTIEHRVIDFGRGTYRGQVQARGSPKQTEWQPHGLGVLTIATGHTCCGQWLNGTQVQYGTRYSPTMHYEGDLGTGHADTTIRHGVGLYTFGALFVGSWDGDAADPQPGHLQPHGLGSLPSLTDSIAVVGWFHGLRCVHQSSPHTDMSASTFELSSRVRSQPQPLRGLLLADEKLQFWRRRAITRAVRRWTWLCCEFITTQAKRSRLLALQSQQQARRAELQAIRENVEREKAAKSQDAAELLALVAKSRDAQEQRRQRRQLYVQRLAVAVKQRDLARACVAKQDSAVKALETELQEIVELVTEARQAQGDCALYARELHVLKRQFENTSVKFNAARFAQQCKVRSVEDSQQEQELPTSLSQRSVPPTPMVKTPRQREDAEDNNFTPHSRGVTTTPRSIAPGQQFVCDVPGCMCGIPRDVFLRVSAALNDE